MVLKKRITLCLFFIGYFAILISLFFSHTRGLLYVGYAFLFINLLLQFREVQFLIRTNFKIIILIVLFLFFLLLAVFYSYYPFTSLEAFLLNYFFNVILFFNIWLLWRKLIKNPFQFRLFLYSTFGINALVNIYFIIFSLISCKTKFSCYVFFGLRGIDQSLLRGLVPLASAYMFFFMFFFTFFLWCETWDRWLFFILSLFDIGFLLWLGRRGPLLSLSVAFLLVSLLFPRFKKAAIIFIGALILVITAILFSPYGKNLLIRSDKIKILLSGDYEKFHKAGSLGKRLYAWPIYFKAALEHPFKGTGLSRKVQKEVLAKVEAKTQIGHAHNIFLTLWLQAGLPTALIFLLFYLWLLKIAKNQARQFYCEREFYIFMGLLVFLVAFLFASLLDGLEKLTRFVPFWLGSGILLGHKSYLEEIKVSKT